MASNYVIRGSVRTKDGGIVKNVKIQAMDSDQEFYEGGVDDIIESVNYWFKHSNCSICAANLLRQKGIFGGSSYHQW